MYSGLSHTLAQGHFRIAKHGSHFDAFVKFQLSIAGR
jgi:hypothetical protein